MIDKSFSPKHFRWSLEDRVGTITLARPERKNPLTFDSYAELRDTFRALVHSPSVKAIVLTGAEGNFCSGGDVHDIIGPLTKVDVGGLLKFAQALHHAGAEVLGHDIAFLDQAQRDLLALGTLQVDDCAALVAVEQ